MPLRLELATHDDVAELVALHIATAERLTAEFGKGSWSSSPTERGVRFHMKIARVYAARGGQGIVGTLALQTRKPWAIDRKYFTACKRPLYLTSMAVRPELQRRGIGRKCLEEAVRLGREWPADSICLDAWDADAGAGAFYAKCGFREVARASFKGTPLVYFEMLLC